MNAKAIDLARVFLKLGIIGFGGPAAHIAMMETEVVERRKWLDKEHFLDLIGATNLIPGPNSTEMAIHVGYSYGGLLGLAVAGICFILPAVTITLGFAWVYVAFGTTPQVAPLLAGIKPAVLAIIAGALWRLGKKAIKSRQLLAIGLLVAILLLLGLNEVLALLVGGIVGMLWLRLGGPSAKAVEAFVGGLGVGAILKAGATGTAATSPTLWQIGLFFLKVGCVLFGSGYVLVAFLEGEVVDNYSWLTQQQLLDAIAIGQLTPGPVLSTSTFIGYQLGGFAGAVVATIGIFLPSFLFVLALNPLVPRLRQSPWSAAFLDAVNVSAVGLMAIVSLRLAFAVLVAPLLENPASPLNWVALGITAAAGVALFRFKVGTAWLVLGGAIVGGVAAWLGA